ADQSPRSHHSCFRQEFSPTQRNDVEPLLHTEQSKIADAAGRHHMIGIDVKISIGPEEFAKEHIHRMSGPGSRAKELGGFFEVSILDKDIFPLSSIKTFPSFDGRGNFVDHQAAGLILLHFSQLEESIPLERFSQTIRSE